MNESIIPKSTCMWRGFRFRCPSCGEGKLFYRFLKPVEHCPACGEALGYIRADDFPPYLTIIVVAHLFVPFVLLFETWGASTTFQLVFWLPMVLAATLLLLPRFKGAVIGLMWSLKLSGYEAR
jgi:uncharacterized protein (DUF983 family)